MVPRSSSPASHNEDSAPNTIQSFQTFQQSLSNVNNEDEFANLEENEGGAHLLSENGLVERSALSLGIQSDNEENVIPGANNEKELEFPE